MDISILDSIEICDLQQYFSDKKLRLRHVSTGNNGIVFLVIDSNGKSTTEVVKLVPIRKQLDDFHIPERMCQEDMEVYTHNLFNDFLNKNQTPHINRMIKCMKSKNEELKNMIKDYIIPNDDKGNLLVKRFNKNKYTNDMYVIISEHANRGNFLDFLIKNSAKMEFVHWKVFLFQIVSVLNVIISKYPTFIHGCFCCRNILVQKNSPSCITSYKINNKIYKVPNFGYYLKINDFDAVNFTGILENLKQTHNSDIKSLFLELLKLGENKIIIPKDVKFFLKDNLAKSSLSIIRSPFFEEFKKENLENIEIEAKKVE